VPISTTGIEHPRSLSFSPTHTNLSRTPNRDGDRKNANSIDQVASVNGFRAALAMEIEWVRVECAPTARRGFCDPVAMGDRRMDRAAHFAEQ
jgi:hypothetical protein